MELNAFLSRGKYLHFHPNVDIWQFSISIKVNIDKGMNGVIRVPPRKKEV